MSGLRNLGAATVALEEVGERRFENVYQLDLRVAKDFRVFSFGTVSVGADIFNATNQRTILQRNGAILNNSGADAATSGGYRITEIQAPRVYRIGAKVTF